MKKILIILMIFLSTFTLFIKVALGYTIVDNTNDWVHWSLSQPLIEIVTNFMNWSITWEQAMQQWQELIQSVSNWWADFTANVDSNWVLHVWCTNNWSLIMVIPDNWGGWQPPEPPAPVVWTETSYGSCEYIASWSPNWSTCNTIWNWNTNWKINCEQINTWSPNNTTASWSCTTTTIDWVPQWDTSCNWSCPASAPKPVDVSEIKTVSIDLSSPATTNTNASANNNDTNNININISAVTNDNKAVINLPNTVSNIKDTSWLKTNRINNTWDNALNFNNVTSQWIVWTWNSFSLPINWIKSYAPLKSDNASLTFELNWIKMVLNWLKYHFEKPYIWDIKVWDNLEENWNWKIDIWTSNKFKLITNEIKNIDETNFNISNFKNNILEYTSDLKVVKKDVDTLTLDKKDWVIFSATLNTSTNSNTISTVPWITIKNPPIVNYTLDWKNISYYLNDKKDWDNSDELKNNNWKSFIWVKIIWNLQWDWKQTITWQESNFTDIDKLWIKTEIRKNAYEYISKLNSWDKVNWVIYYSWNKKLSEIDLNQVETIVVKDWNLIIDQNIINNIWIIVLKDGYNVDNWYMGSWNVYVTPSVTFIKAIIYADGWFISVKNDWTIYSDDNFIRSNDLKNQLIMEWSLFTRNTIGWSILSGWDYILPWNKKISWIDDNFYKAMVYDLNYIRRSNNWCDKNSPKNNLCTDSWEYTEAFIIKYNSENQVNTPKLFSSN